MQKLINIKDGVVKPHLADGKYFIEKFVTRRSQPMNRLYWFYLGVLSDETGNDVDVLHDLFKYKFLTRETIVVKGKSGEHVLERIPSTASLDSLTFTNYLSRIEAFTGIPIPRIEDDPMYIHN